MLVDTGITETTFLARFPAPNQQAPAPEEMELEAAQEDSVHPGEEEVAVVSFH